MLTSTLLITLALVQSPAPTTIVSLVLSPDRVAEVTLIDARAEFRRLGGQQVMTAEETRRYTALWKGLSVTRAIEQCSRNRIRFGSRVNNVTCLPEGP
jgi:hypothetical protein